MRCLCRGNAYDESDDTEQNAKSGYLPGVGR